MPLSFLRKPLLTQPPHPCHRPSVIQAKVRRGVSARVHAATALSLAACEASAPRTAPAQPTTAEPFSSQETTLMPNDVTPSSRCLLAGSDWMEREDAFTDIGSSYAIATTDDCRVRGLTRSLSNDQSVDWGNYLVNFTSAFFGCGLLFTPLPGGREAFGPGNIEAVGAASLALGVDDVTTLIDLYLASCGSELPLPPDELREMRTQLEVAATGRLDVTLRSQLSDCLTSAE
jgi:hypothetical protein